MANDTVWNACQKENNNKQMRLDKTTRRSVFDFTLRKNGHGMVEFRADSL